MGWGVVVVVARSAAGMQTPRARPLVRSLLRSPSPEIHPLTDRFLAENDVPPGPRMPKSAAAGYVAAMP